MNSRAEFLLKGYAQKEKIHFSYENQTFHICPIYKNIEKLENLTQELIVSAETAVLEIPGYQTEDKLVETAQDINNLLSLALGKRIVFDRQIYWDGTTSRIVPREMSKNGNSGSTIIPDFELGNFLTKSLPIYSNYSKSEKDILNVVTDFLNQTSLDFIDDRILKLFQAWECAANNWTDKVQLSSDLQKLQDRLMNEFSNWKKELDYKDVEGELGTRLKLCLEQEKVMIRLQSLIVQNHLNEDKLNLNLRKIKQQRDQVAHNGRINISGFEAVKLLEPGVTGLQLIILKRLAYDGMVIGNDRTEPASWRTFEKINEYFN